MATLSHNIHNMMQRLICNSRISRFQTIARTSQFSTPLFLLDLDCRTINRVGNNASERHGDRYRVYCENLTVLRRSPRLLQPRRWNSIVQLTLTKIYVVLHRPPVNLELMDDRTFRNLSINSDTTTESGKT